MLQERARHYYLNENRNCSEAVMLAANDTYQLGLTNDELKLLGGFGGGMGCGSLCGALAGGIAILGRMNIKTIAHETDGLKELCADFVDQFHRRLGSTSCDELTAKYRREDVRCLEAVELAAQLLEEFISGDQTSAPQQEVTVSAEDIKRVKAMGFLHCKGTDNFNGRIITRNGKITSQEAQCISEAARLYGNGELAMTTRLTIEVQQIPYKNITAFQEYLAKEGLMTGGTGSKIRPVVSCKGTTCQYGLIDTNALSLKIHERFFLGYNNVKLPHKFKVAVGGCPNNCVKPDLNDLGIVGQRVPVLNAEVCRSCKKCSVVTGCPVGGCELKDGKPVFTEACNNCGRCIKSCPFHAVEAYQNGYKVYIGGRWGKKVAQGRALRKIFTTEEEVLSVVEKAMLLFREQGKTGERFADTVQRLGFDNVEAQLIGDEILARKADILGAEMHTVGGATC
ncbi:MAG: C-GCAxxG-C-C family (seleno)protein [Eubacteriales bacterium]|jgi:C_GCAxxG_C_C family probable redox protein